MNTNAEIPTLQFAMATAVVALCVQVSGPAAAQDADVKTMPVNGVPLEYVEQGEGEPVVFVHGAISDHRVFEGQREAIAEDYQFVAYTRRYFGEQPWPDQGENYGDDTHTADLIAFVEGLNRGPVHLVAHSGGGSIALFAALERPDLFRSIVLYEPGGALRQLLTTPEGDAANTARQEAQAPANEAAAAGRLDEAVELFVDAVNRPGAYDMTSSARSSRPRISRARAPWSFAPLRRTGRSTARPSRRSTFRPSSSRASLPWTTSP